MTFPSDDGSGWVDRFLEVAAEDLPVETRLSLEVVIRVGRLTARVQSENLAAGNGLSSGDMDMLAALATQGAPFRAKPTDLATWAGVTNGTMTARIDRIENRGLVYRTIDAEDRRIRWICLTDSGLDCIRDQARQAFKLPLFYAIDNLPDRDKRTLTKLLRKLG